MPSERILISRTDRAGDLLLTMPVFRELRRAYPDAHLVAHVRSYTAPLAGMVKEIDEIIIDDALAAGMFSTELAESFRRLTFDCCIMVHPAVRAIIAAWRAGIPRRIGRASNIFQLFLNDRRVQKRSKNDKHEYQYNLDLLQNFVSTIDYSPWRFTPPAELTDRGQKYLAAVGLLNLRPVIVHPGHGGSAHNIGTDMYAKIVSDLLSHKIPVLVSLGPGEQKLKQAFPQPRAGNLAFADSIPDLAELAGVFSACSAFCGGSTGPLHLAAALGLPCAAFFPPVAAMTPKRWGPVGCPSIIIEPDIAACSGRCDSCPHKGCMSRLKTEEAVDWLAREYNR